MATNEWCIGELGAVCVVHAAVSDTTTMCIPNASYKVPIIESVRKHLSHLRSISYNVIDWGLDRSETCCIAVLNFFTRVYTQLWSTACRRIIEKCLCNAMIHRMTAGQTEAILQKMSRSLAGANDALLHTHQSWNTCYIAWGRCKMSTDRREDALVHSIVVLSL